ncbi:toxin-antitoxin system YwqK family antitoxin [Melittangium boletus]|uniref:toxin-antitoxin system YwqK family antitoxin n=1 Tax=Melittangium boletus TaxID=83453 RepID=UPI0012FDA9E4|nr:toxin-antitoxin system YwqK family antitoxin [Melittangium boletus]
MSISMMGRALVVGLILGATDSLAADDAYKLDCPVGTRQTGEPQEGISCRKPDTSNGRGVAHGPYVSFYANGQKSAEGQFVDGFRSGSWTFYTQDGQVRSRIEFSVGNYHGRREEYFPNGRLRTVESYVHGKLDGLVKEFSSDGRLVKQSEYRNNRQVVAE